MEMWDRLLPFASNPERLHAGGEWMFCSILSPLWFGLKLILLCLFGHPELTWEMKLRWQLLEHTVIGFVPLKRTKNTFYSFYFYHTSSMYSLGRGVPADTCEHTKHTFHINEAIFHLLLFFCGLLFFRRLFWHFQWFNTLISLVFHVNLCKNLIF